MNKTKIAIIGASYLQLPLVQKAHDLGLETHCFAWEEGAVCKKFADYFYPISILEKEEILKQCRQKQINGITTIATDMAVPTVCFVAEKMGLISNSYNSALVSTNKALMRERFNRYNVVSPKHIVINGDILKNINYPMIVKPVDRSGSRGVAKVSSPDEMFTAILNARDESLSDEVIIEEFIEGNEISVECISWKGKHYLLAITDKVTTGEPNFVELAHHQPTQLSSDFQKLIRDETIKALDALDIKFGASHTEFKITNKGELYIIEVGARMGGDFIGSHLVKLSTGYDYLKGVIACALNQFEEPRVEFLKFSGVYFLCKETEYLKPYFEGSNPFDIEKKIIRHNLQFISNSNDRSGYLIYCDINKIILS